MPKTPTDITIQLRDDQAEDLQGYADWRDIPIEQAAREAMLRGLTWAKSAWIG